MTTEFELQAGIARLATMMPERVWAEGRVAPRLVVSLKCLPKDPYTRLQLRQLKTDIRLANQSTELICMADLAQAVVDVPRDGADVILYAALSHEALALIDAEQSPNSVELRLEFRGLLLATTAAPEDSGGPSQQSAWHEYAVWSAQNTVRVPREEWIGDVVQPLQGPSHILLDLPLPKPPDEERWRAALEHLRQAERFAHDGNDAEVLQQCYAAFDVLEGAPKNILERLPATARAKRDRVDEALVGFRTYLQNGLHLTTEGRTEGEFGVDRRDAEFALSQTKLWLAYIARLLADAK